MAEGSNKPSAQEIQEQYDVEKNIAMQEKFDQFVEMAGEEDYELDMEELSQIFALVKKYAQNIEKHKNSRVQNPELLRAYVDQLDSILSEIKDAQQLIAHGKESLGNYKKLRRNQLLFAGMLYSSVAIIGGRYYNSKDMRNRKALARADAKIARASSRKKAEKVAGLKAKKGNLEARQRELADDIVKAHYKKLNPRFWEIGTRRHKKQADYAALNDYITDAVKKYEAKTEEIRKKIDNNSPYNPITWYRSVRLITREGLQPKNTKGEPQQPAQENEERSFPFDFDQDTNEPKKVETPEDTQEKWYHNIRWLGVSPFGIRLRHLENKMGKFNGGKPVVKGVDNKDIIQYFNRVDKSYIGTRKQL